MKNNSLIVFLGAMWILSLIAWFVSTAFGNVTAMWITNGAMWLFLLLEILVKRTKLFHKKQPLEELPKVLDLNE